jgi:hypothetical protein
LIKCAKNLALAENLSALNDDGFGVFDTASTPAVVIFVNP